MLFMTGTTATLTRRKSHNGLLKVQESSRHVKLWHRYYLRHSSFSRIPEFKSLCHYWATQPKDTFSQPGMGILYLPRQFPQTDTITRLDLSGNSLNMFPVEIVNLPKLESLNLANCGFGTIPTEVMTLLSQRVPGLTDLNVGFNRITQLPSSLALLPMKRLLLNNNWIQGIIVF